MQTFLSMAANRAVDDYAIKRCGIPGETLMKNAGDAVIRQMESHGTLKNSQQVVVLAGKGNNGGDGYVIAHGLSQRDIKVTVLTVANESEIQGDALVHYKIMRKQGVSSELWDNSKPQQEHLRGADLIIDALLGTGISGEIREPFKEIINQCNKSSAVVIAVDVPSGITGDLGQILEPCIKADLTVSMGFGKQGCLFEPAKSKCGIIEPVAIGFPEDSLEQVETQIIKKLEATDFPPDQFTRLPDSHKYSSGKVYLIAGSRGYSGAALLASSAALRSGAGLVKLGIPASLGSIAESISKETIVDYLPETADQCLAGDSYSQLKAGCDWADVVALGPGIGRHQETLELTQQLIADIDRPLVIDADALFALSLNVEVLKQRAAPTILTPHLGEFKRLTGIEFPTWKDAVDFAKSYGVFVLLKGAPSILATPTGEVTVNSTGYAGMATAGSGDVLTGVLASLWSQWDTVPKVLNFAMYVHGKAAEHCRDEKGVLGLIAGDIVDSLPAALKEYGGLPV